MRVFEDLTKILDSQVIDQILASSILQKLNYRVIILFGYQQRRAVLNRVRP